MVCAQERDSQECAACRRAGQRPLAAFGAEEEQQNQGQPERGHLALKQTLVAQESSQSERTAAQQRAGSRHAQVSAEGISEQDREPMYGYVESVDRRDLDS